MSYQLYRNTTIGNALQETLEEEIRNGLISHQLASKGELKCFQGIIKYISEITVLEQFDKSINTALSSKVKNCITFRAGKLQTYRFCDNVWTLM